MYDTKDALKKYSISFADARNDFTTFEISGMF